MDISEMRKIRKSRYRRELSSIIRRKECVVVMCKNEQAMVHLGGVMADVYMTLAVTDDGH